MRVLLFCALALLGILGADAVRLECKENRKLPGALFRLDATLYTFPVETISNGQCETLCIEMANQECEAAILEDNIELTCPVYFWHFRFVVHDPKCIRSNATVKGTKAFWFEPEGEIVKMPLNLLFDDKMAQLLPNTTLPAETTPTTTTEPTTTVVEERKKGSDEMKSGASHSATLFLTIGIVVLSVF